MIQWAWNWVNAIYVVKGKSDSGAVTITVRFLKEKSDQNCKRQKISKQNGGIFEKINPEEN